MTFTEKEMIKEIKERISSLDVRDDIERRAYEITLASLEAEPIAWECGENIILFNPDTVEAYAKRAEISPKPLFSAPPALVVPEFETWFNSQESGRSICSTQIRRSLQEISWNACCAAMLHGAEPVSQTYKLNELSGNSPVTPGGWISCSDRMPEDTKMLLAFSQGEIVAAYWNWVVNPIDYKKYRAFTYLSGNILDDVTHWMSLPEPPL